MVFGLFFQGGPKVPGPTSREDTPSLRAAGTGSKNESANSGTMLTALNTGTSGGEQPALLLALVYQLPKRPY